jgi:hypothetical protein
MSLCHETYRRCASFALVLALVLIALPSLLNAQTAQSDDTVPKAELFIGYQWLNPGGNVPDQSTPPNAIQLPSMARGFGTSLSYNFTKNLALEGNYGGNSYHDENNNTRDASINEVAVGPKLTYRGEGVNFFVHALIGYERLLSTGNDSSHGVAAILGGGMDLKLWKPVSLRLFEADFQWSHQNFASVVPPEDGSLRRPTYDGVLLRTGLVFNFGGGAPEVPVAGDCFV